MLTGWQWGRLAVANDAGITSDGFVAKGWVMRWRASAVQGNKLGRGNKRGLVPLVLV